MELKMTCGFCNAELPMPEQIVYGAVYECSECKQRFRFVKIDNRHIGMEKAG